MAKVKAKKIRITKKKVKLPEKNAKKRKHVKMNTGFKVENIVASAALGVELDLFSIATNLDNVEYEPEQFPGAIMRLKDIGTTLLLFKNGKVICSGAKSEAQIGRSMRKAASILRDYVREEQ